LTQGVDPGMKIACTWHYRLVKLGSFIVYSMRYGFICMPRWSLGVVIYLYSKPETFQLLDRFKRPSRSFFPTQLWCNAFIGFKEVYREMFKICAGIIISLARMSLIGCYQKKPWQKQQVLIFATCCSPDWSCVLTEVQSISILRYKSKLNILRIQIFIMW